MNREQKTEVIGSLKNEFTNSQASFVVGYKGLTVKQMQSLRKELREKQGTLTVAKARLMKRAVENVEGVSGLTPYLKDQIGVVFVTQDASAVAKVLYDFSKKHQALHLVAGFFDSTVLPSEGVARIATLPPREVLLAQLCGVLQAPTTKLVVVLNMQILRLLWTLKKVAESKEA